MIESVEMPNISSNYSYFSSIYDKNCQN